MGFIYLVWYAFPLTSPVIHFFFPSQIERGWITDNTVIQDATVNFMFCGDLVRRTKERDREKKKAKNPIWEKRSFILRCAYALRMKRINTISVKCFRNMLGCHLKWNINATRISFSSWFIWKFNYVMEFHFMH